MPGHGPSCPCAAASLGHWTTAGLAEIGACRHQGLRLLLREESLLLRLLLELLLLLLHLQLALLLGVKVLLLLLELLLLG